MIAPTMPSTKTNGSHATNSELSPTQNEASASPRRFAGSNCGTGDIAGATDGSTKR